MPTYKDVTVQVHEVEDDDTYPLMEYGVHKRDRSNLVTCYIRSQSDMPFSIRMEPTPKLVGESWGAVYSSAPGPPRDWNLLATLRLDGRETYEKRMFIYLDDTDPYFNRPDGEVVMRTRTLRDGAGRLRDCGWLFKEPGPFRRETEAVPAKDEDKLADAFTALGANGLEDAEEKSSVGQIEITLERVIVGETTYGGRLPYDYIRHGMGPMPGNISTMTHAAARDGGSRNYGGPNVEVLYKPYDKPGEVYARFKFFYRNEATLCKLGFLEPTNPPAPLPSISKRQREEALNKAAAAPLSTTKPEHQRYIRNEQGGVIGVEDRPTGDPNASRRASEKAVDDGSMWKPKNQLLPAIKVDNGAHLEGIDSPPTSLTTDDDGSERTPYLSSSSRTTSMKANTRADQDKGTPGEADQSSADEASPLKHRSLPSQGAGLFTPRANEFRNLLSPDDGEEADDEASERISTPTTTGILERNDNTVGDLDEGEDGGLSQNRPDGGLGAKLGELKLDRKRSGQDEEGEEDAKKARIDSHATLEIVGKEGLTEQQQSLTQQEEASDEEEL